MTIDNPSAEPVLATPAYNAWLRTRGHRWAIAAQGETEREASDKLNTVIQERGPGHYDLLVLPSGEEP